MESSDIGGTRFSILAAIAVACLTIRVSGAAVMPPPLALGVEQLD